MNKFGAVAVALMASLALGACGSNSKAETVNFDLECDAGDYIQQDIDCGWMNNGNWEYYYWTKRGETTYSPDGWYPPEQVASMYVEEERTTYKTSKPKKRVTTKTPSVNTKKPATSTYKPPAAAAPKVKVGK